MQLQHLLQLPRPRKGLKLLCPCLISFVYFLLINFPFYLQLCQFLTALFLKYPCHLPNRFHFKVSKEYWPELSKTKACRPPSRLSVNFLLYQTCLLQTHRLISWLDFLKHCFYQDLVLNQHKDQLIYLTFL